MGFQSDSLVLLIVHRIWRGLVHQIDSVQPRAVTHRYLKIEYSAMRYLGIDNSENG
jgi:hypothetical protein